MFMVNKVPGFAAQMRKDGQTRPGRRSGDASPNGKTQDNLRSRDNSPKTPRPRSEEIPLEDMRLRKSSLNGSPASSFASSDSQDAPVLNLSVNTESVTMSKKRSEETSFTSTQNQQLKPRRKGQVEIV